MITLEDIIVTSVSTEGSNSARLTENVTLNFAKYLLEYTEQIADGSAGAARGRLGYRPESGAVDSARGEPGNPAGVLAKAGPSGSAATAWLAGRSAAIRGRGPRPLPFRPPAPSARVTAAGSTTRRLDGRTTPAALPPRPSRAPGSDVRVRPPTITTGGHAPSGTTPLWRPVACVLISPPWIPSGNRAKQPALAPAVVDHFDREADSQPGRDLLKFGLLALVFECVMMKCVPRTAWAYLPSGSVLTSGRLFTVSRRRRTASGPNASMTSAKVSAAVAR